MDKPKQGETRKIKYIHSDTGVNTIIYQKFINDQWYFHREDGPAANWGDGTKVYFLEGHRYPEEEFLAKTTKLGKIIYG